MGGLVGKINDGLLTLENVECGRDEGDDTDGKDEGCGGK